MLVWPKTLLEKPIYSTQQHLRSQNTGSSKRTETEASLPNPSQAEGGKIGGRQERNKMTQCCDDSLILGVTYVSSWGKVYTG